MSIRLTINDRPVTATPGQTVLEAASAAGIEIPTLCHHPRLPEAGSCRVCLVEIEKQRNLQPACTFPVSEGLVVHTESPKVVEARVFSLQLIFSERPHYCMTCPSSGSGENTDCELQKLAYRYGLTNWMFPPDFSHRWPVDATGKHFVLDHGRCILCRRCVRACANLSANHTLGVHNRGAKTMVCADDDLPLGKSSCVSCGTCLQVCPTGAIVDKMSAFSGHETDSQRIKSTCVGCAVGCGIEAVVRDNQLLRIEGDWDASNSGLLCETGRFLSVDSRPARVNKPMLRKDDKLVEVGWEEVLTAAADKLRRGDQAAGLISPRLTNRLLAGFACFFNETLGSDQVSLLYGNVPPLDLGKHASLSDIASADRIVIIEADPLKNQKVVGYLVRRAVDRGARLLLINDHPTDLDRWASEKLPLKDISRTAVSPFAQLHYTYHLGVGGMSRVKSTVSGGERPLVMYGPGLSPTVYAGLRTLGPRTMFLPLVEGANAIGAQRIGLEVREVRGRTLYVLCGDDLPDGQPVPQAECLIVQSAYRTRWTEAADIVLPARTWTEKPGQFVNIEGRACGLTPLQKMPEAVHADLETLVLLSSKLGAPLSFDQISDICAAV